MAVSMSKRREKIVIEKIIKRLDTLYALSYTYKNDSGGHL